MGLAQLIKWLTALNIGTGVNSGSYVARASYASLPAASGFPAGTKAWATDIGKHGSEVVEDGGDWAVVYQAKQLVNTIYTAGDSLTKSGWVSVGNTFYNTPNEGVFNWFNAFLGAPFNYLGNTSAGGKTCRQMIDEQFPTIIAAQPHYCWFTAGHNDLYSEGATVDECYSRIVEAVETLMNAGITPIWSTIWCRSYDSFVTPDAIKLNDKLRRYAFSNDCGLFWDGALITNDPSSSNYEGRLPLSSYYYDSNIHPNNLLSLRIGQYAASQLSNHIYKPNFRSVGAETVARAGSANLLLNPGFIGSGAASASGVAGVIPTGWKIEWNRAVSATATCAIINITDPATGFSIANAVQVTISGTCVDGDLLYIKQTDTENSAIRTNLAAGNVVQAEVSMSLSSASNITKLYCRAQTNSTESTFAGLNTETPVPYPSNVPAHTLRSRQMTVLGSGTASQARFDVIVGFNGAGTGSVITIWSPRLRKVQ